MWVTHIQESNENFFPNRDAILYSFSIESNITYLTKHLKPDNSRIFDIAKYYRFFLLPQI